ANFDMISYAKGAAVLKQLFAHVGRDNFINGLKAYFDKHAFKNTTLNDLLVEFEATSGRSLKPWVDTWLLTAGVNTLRPVLKIDGDTYASVAIAQEAPKIPVGSTELRPHRLSIALYDNVNGEIKLRKSHELDVAGALTTVPEFAGEKVSDLLLINDGDLTYAKIRFDERSIATLKKDLGKIKDSLTRALCWSAAWDMARDAEISATDFVDIAIAGLAGESEVSTVTGLGFQLTTTIELYAHPSHRDALRSRLADACAGFLAAAESGSDHQLQFAKMFTTNATSPEHIERIKALLDGKLPGLKVDADLRWFFVIALTDLGVFGRAEIDAELARDKTKTGEESHAQAIATIPTLEAKQAAWKIITAPETSNSIRAKSIVGFQSIGQRELIAQFADKYFAELQTIWGQGFETGSTFVEQMYPIAVTTQAMLDKSYQWLKNEGKDSPAMLQRYVNEAAEGLARALRAQERDK
ncbi:MAG: aminopeptidase N, partial [Actinobacteria bacterium]|nr:aminopeptidase N [Actinomycetota bacterium]